MASILDLGFLSNFSPIFTFLFLFAVMYGLFTYTKFLGDNKSLQALIAFVIAIIASINQSVVQIITRMTPWYVLLFFFITFIIIGFKTMGATDKDITGILHKAEFGSTIGWWIIILSVIIAISAISSVMGSGLLSHSQDNKTITAGKIVEINPEGGALAGDTGSTATKSFSTNLYNTIFNPKVLGLLVVLAIAAIAVTSLTKSVQVIK